MGEHWTTEEIKASLPNIPMGNMFPASDCDIEIYMEESEKAARFGHLRDCESCQALLREHCWVLFCGPSRGSLDEIRTDRQDAFSLDQWHNSCRGECCGLSQYHEKLIEHSSFRHFWKHQEHIQTCDHCQAGLDFLMRSCLLSRGTDYRPHMEFLKIAWMLSDIDEIKRSGEGTRCFKSCPQLTDMGPNKVIFVPKSPEWRKYHPKHCLYCRLLLHYCQHQSRFRSWSCLSNLAWRTFPTRHPADAGMWEHLAHNAEDIYNCSACRGHVELRLRINFAGDKQRFDKYSKLSRLKRWWKHFLREKISRRWGDWVLGWRAMSTPFPVYPNQYLWHKEDGILKLVRNTNLTEIEKEYRRALTGEASLDEAIQKILAYFEIKTEVE